MSRLRHLDLQFASTWFTRHAVPCNIVWFSECVC